ncbi:riboflavin synthase [Gordonia liuliyuniae]|uniref:Riboflavin synthase n=1 Tax=Gordonia liuliyuniae TaxID=2911517 RepID=A0ABS9IR12_9ACTN|nr:riboflavin synthase [Gordonia liuliyuniae]MCF8587988.1 riboflavin synthase [Gordonia liuliyuniae]
MFTGIVEERGEIVGREDLEEAARFRIRGPLVTSDASFGDSIAVNGVCLTVVELGDADFVVDVMAETLKRSSLDALSAGAPVNLERAMAADGRFGGHIVQGHVDGVGSVVSVSPSENWTVVRVAVPADLARYVVEKGSITVDGISLTVSSIGADAEYGDWLEVSLIPTTLAETTLGTVTTGVHVNLEVDVIAKYVERLQSAGTDGGQR